MAISGANISAIIGKSVKNAFVYYVPGKSILKYIFSFEICFHSNSTHHRNTETPSPRYWPKAPKKTRCICGRCFL